MTERVIIRIPSRVAELAEEFDYRNWRKDADGNAISDKRSRGWFALFEGSRERLLVGPTKPENLNVGDTVFIDIVKRT